MKALFIQPKESLLDRAIRIQHDKGKEKASDEAKVSSSGIFSGSTSGSSVVASNEDAVTSSCKNANQ